MMTWQQLRKKLKKFLNLVDNPIDNIKHWLYRNRQIKGDWWYRIRVPMKNKGYFGFEIAIYKKGEKKDE